jgi:hypothetical protein
MDNASVVLTEVFTTHKRPLCAQESRSHRMLKCRRIVSAESASSLHQPLSADGILWIGKNLPIVLRFSPP